MKHKQRCLICFFLFIALFGIQPQAFALDENQSVKEYMDDSNVGEENGVVQEEQSNRNEQPEVIEKSSQVGLSVWDFVKMIFATLFVVVLLYFVLKLINKKGAFHQKSNTLVSLGGITVGTNRSIQLIKVGDRLLVVGVGENIQLLSEIEKGEEFDQIITDYNQKLDQMIQPNDVITRLTEIVKGKRNGVEANSPSFPALLKKQLDEILSDRKNMLDKLQSKKDKDRS